MLKTGKAEDAEPLVENITDVIVTAGNLSIFRKSYTNKWKRPKKVNKKWYDIDCQKLLRDVKSSKKCSEQKYNKRFSKNSILQEV